jgi:ribonuclease P/MRP protein subunit RPP40
VAQVERTFIRFANEVFQLTLVLPTDQAEDLKSSLEKDVGVLQYTQVYMKLSELIEGDFFNHYIKSGT